MKQKTVTLSTKAMALMFAAVLLLGGTIGGTLAWLVDKGEVVNTFTYGDINISLWEHVWDDETGALSTTEVTYDGNEDLKILPGVDIPKDPTITVEAGSEPCWLFVQITEDPAFIEDAISYSIDSDAGWLKLAKNSADELIDGVYYINLSDATFAENVDYNILADKIVSGSEDLTKDEIDALEESGESPALIFTAYAVQYNSTSIKDVKTAWDIAQSNDDEGTTGADDTDPDSED